MHPYPLKLTILPRIDISELKSDPGIDSDIQLNAFYDDMPLPGLGTEVDYLSVWLISHKFYSV